MLDRAAVATGIDPSPGIAFGTLLGLGAFTTVSWLSQFGDAREYLRYPIEYGRVFSGLLGAYLLCSVPVGLCYLAAATLWFPPGELVSGLAVFPAVAVYVFGATAFVTGLSPNNLLFDTGRFALFGAALATLAVPLLVAALAVDAYPVGARVLALGLAGGGATVGFVLTARAGPRWETRLRAGDYG